MPGPKLVIQASPMQAWAEVDVGRRPDGLALKGLEPTVREVKVLGWAPP